MLGTRVIMLGMNQFPGGDQTQNQAEVIAVANHAIPPFWLLLFSAEDMRLLATQSVAEEGLSRSSAQSYPVLMAERLTALEHLNAHSQTLTAQLTATENQLLQRWRGHLQQMDFPVVAIDTYELWQNLKNPEQLQPDLERLLKSPDKSQQTTSGVPAALRKDGQWQENNPIALAGFGW